MICSSEGEVDEDEEVDDGALVRRVESILMEGLYGRPPKPNFVPRGLCGGEGGRGRSVLLLSVSEEDMVLICVSESMNGMLWQQVSRQHIVEMKRR